MKIAIIPARGGSKRIPGKNVKIFAGRPVIAYSIAAAHATGLFDHVIVSTDDEEIAAIARDHGAEVPFIRPPELSGDHMGTTPVTQHAIRWFQTAGADVSYSCTLYATAPFIRAADVVAAFEILESSGASYSFPVTSFPFPIQRAVRLDDGGRVAMFHPEHRLTRSQDLEPAYHDAGQFYWGRAAAYLADEPVIGAGAVPLVIPRWRVQDIDTPEDWRRAELMYEALK
ncbi:pseudaminic acid cytidylyltransferase [Govanella unica]|uniref:Pseudaminic acid cytidylyltransferase n=1 Tax=Govanella unica TaxID=2975056 RepID=A0A9X3TZN9_9PROT|nr:pseudaminic acid cytidylyltransferase [Govania unica]MDA5194711.1 pseudaminic acid cytidylyltransferase [Govania unica]